MRYILAKANDYLWHEDIPGQSNKRRIVTNPYQASDFLERTIFGLFPKGVFVAWLNKNYQLLSLSVAFISGIVLSTIVYIITWVVTGSPK